MHEGNIVNVFLLLSQKKIFQEYMPFYFNLKKQQEI